MSRFSASILLIGLAALMIVDTAPAQDREREARKVASFTNVAFSIPGTLHLRQGSPRSVEVEGTRTVLDHLETTVDDGQLTIRDESNFFEKMFGDDVDGEVDVYVTAPTLDAISLAGSGTVMGETAIENASLSLSNAGSGTMDLEVSTSDLRTRIAGSGTLRLRGTANDAQVRITGSGTVHALSLTTKTADVEVTGSGDTRLHVADALTVKIMGSGDVAYRGSPSIDTNILGSGEVQSADE